MSRYYKDDSFGRFVFKAFIIALVMQILFVAFEFISIKTAKHELIAEAEIGTVVYSESENTSKLTVSAALKHRDHSHTVVTDVSYKLLLKDSGGNVLYEEERTHADAITEEKTEIEFSFESDETKITGKVASAEIDIINESYVNKVAHEGGSVGIKYLLENWLLIVSFFLPLFIMTLGYVLADLFDGFFSYVVIVIAFGASGFILKLIMPEIAMALLA